MRILMMISAVLLLSACGTNPVTGKHQLILMSQSQEIALGERQYSPSQQSQGGTYTIDPALNNYINRIGQNLAQHSGQTHLPYEFVVLNNPTPNAWALPGGKIAINSGLLIELEDEAQLAAVLGHEIVHAAARHGAERQTAALGTGLLASIAVMSTDKPLYQQAALIGATGFQAKYGRDNELEADHYGINYMVAAGYDPQAAVELQQTFVRLSQGKRSNWFSGLFASHPPSSERVVKNRLRAQVLPAGKRNRNAFLAATAQLRKDQKAYKKHRQATIAAQEHAWDSALALTDEAIKLQPKEARFYITRGRLLGEKRQDKQAMAAFNQAVTLEPDYFMGRLYRGIGFYKAQDYMRAEADLLASNRLLPTQPAHFYLGDMAQTKNQKRQAMQYYQQAAQGGGELGETAAARLKQLSLQ
ncbi:MAG: M48 family metalloprotease [Cellvibrionaceae bacterium]|nr:M48 family metalloprotease [Cellvibrionaceae bacterium]